jgi:hypothetical protein
MKQCPKCGKTYVDAALNFCLEDGTQLAGVEVSEPTVVMERGAPPRKGRALLWTAIVAVILIAAIGIVAAFLIMNNLGRQDTKASVTATTSPTPGSTQRPKASPTVTAVQSSPTPDATVSPSEPEGSDEVTPIAWDTTAGGFKGDPGRTYKFECPPDGTPQAVWGSDIYTDYSSICTAAVHAGLITVVDGGVVTLEYRPGRAIYGSTTRHDVKTNTAGEYARSFVVR